MNRTLIRMTTSIIKMHSFKKALKLFREYDRIAKISEIGRRYFAMNSFDGILTIMGILLGSFFGEVTDSRIIIMTSLGACIAMGVSGTWGTYLTEEAERKKKLKELERATLRKLDNTKIEKAEKVAIFVTSLIDGLSPALSALVVILPFFFVKFISINYAYFISLGIAFVLLALLGGFLGRISRENIILGSLKMMVAGIVCLILSLFLQTF
ncbi:hypothetical protein JXB41_04850 [Candidatus Woesearchaeota archaeon]|nr:hypothetical protein [Candidatus Woesearchaeota archaeon]